MVDRIPREFSDAIDAIERPPCEFCKHWRPSLIPPFQGRGYGLKLCHSPTMQFDFSCFEPVAEA